MAINDFEFNAAEINGSAASSYNADFLETITVQDSIVNQSIIEILEAVSFVTAFDERSRLHGGITESLVAADTVVNAFSGGYAGHYAETVDMADLHIQTVSTAIKELVGVGDALSSGGTFVFAVVDAVGISEKHTLSFVADFADAILIDGEPVLTRETVLAFSESLIANDIVETTLHGMFALADALATTAEISLGFAIDLSESLGISEDSTLDAKKVFAAIESMVFGDTSEMTATILFSFDETINSTAEISTQAAMHMALAEGIEFGGVLNTPEGTFDAWVINAETKAPWMYSNFPFNSFTYAGGKYLALSDNGLYTLIGNTDDGVIIDSIIKTGLMNFGSSMKKSIPRAYFGYSADGRLLFKTITTDTGKKIERWYELKERTADDITAARVKMARGVKAVYWQFEIVNVDGADFDIDSIKLLPAILKRRV